jgi:hypothetical protein
VPHRGRDVRARFDTRGAVFRILKELYPDPQPAATEPKSRKTPKKTGRNNEIRRRYKNGETMAQLAQHFSLSEQRIHQIIRAKRR